MKFKSLKANIAVTTCFLILLAVGLTDFVLVRVIEKQLVQHRIEMGRQWLQRTAESLDWQQKASPGAADLPQKSAAELFSFVNYAVFYNETGASKAFGRAPDHVAPALSYLKREVTASGAFVYELTGETWGVFWRQQRYLVVGAPFQDGSAFGAAVIALGPVYEILRASHQVASVYLVLNFFVFSALGIYRFSRLMTRPIQRFIKITESFHPSGRFDLFPEKQHDEFSRLSSALNRMMQRIEEDQHKLQRSLQSIENANRELKSAQQEIIRAEKLASIGRLSAGLAHEIGNPIGVILGYLGLIKTRAIAPDDATSLDFISRAEAEINRINTIIRQLLDFSRSSPVDYSAVSVHDLVADVGQMLSCQPLTEEIELQYDFAAEDDTVYADYNQLHQVMVNLVINAADSIAMSDNAGAGKIRVATRQPAKAGMLELRVSDNGIGIAEENLDQIFDPFFTTKETGKGTGLGLSVCYMIIEQFGGTITAESTYGAGTTMVVELPLGKRPTDTAPDNAVGIT